MRQLPAGTSEVARLAIGMLLQVVLVVRSITGEPDVTVNASDLKRFRDLGDQHEAVQVVAVSMRGTPDNAPIPHYGQPDPHWLGMRWVDHHWRMTTGTGGDMDWAEVATRLAPARNYWLGTTTAGGAPHAAPVWGVDHDHDDAPADHDHDGSADHDHYRYGPNARKCGMGSGIGVVRWNQRLW